ncbi:MAG: TylF/MycF family methyltransferase [Deltaproteobacteria bacterium]|nr:TylF/MycF family methyltransferase [Deltaproteobacteria bacterium]
MHRKRDYDKKFLYKPNLDFCRYAFLAQNAAEINNENIEGATAEAGVYRGDFAALINKFFPNKKLYLFDTFNDFDSRDLENDPSNAIVKYWGDTSENVVLSKMPYKENIEIRKGYFPETAKGLEEERFAFVSLDMDLYKPMKSGLEFFYPKLSSGGIIMAHDYYHHGYSAKQAIDEFAKEKAIPFIVLTDFAGTAVFKKPL